MASSFSLPRLPQKELSTVLLCMTHIDRIFYSLCSNKCKKSVMGLNLKALKLHVCFSNDFEMYLEFDDEEVKLITRPENNQNPVLNLDARQDLVVEPFPQNGITSWNYNSLSCYEWLVHCMEIYQIKIIDKVRLFLDNYIFDQVRRVLELPQIQIIMTDTDVSAELAHEILSLHLQCKQVSISVDSFGRTNRFGSMENLRKAIVQNVDNVCLRGNTLHFALPLILDDILLTNASQLSLEDSKLSGKDLNRFLKIWIRSPMRRLKTLKVEISNQLDLINNQIMRGIYHTAIARKELEVKIKAYNYNAADCQKIRSGGFNIRSRDGRKATLSLTIGNQVSHVQFFVWN